MEVFIGILQLVFILFVVSIGLLFIFFLLLTWTWAQNLEDEGSENANLSDLFSTTAIEWGAILTLVLNQILSAETFWEAPPLNESAPNPKMVPILFVPSLHTSAGIYRILIWRLKKHFFTSLWPFSWKPFLMMNDLLEDQLLQFIHDVLRNTRSHKLRVISFGSSRPIVSRVLQHSSLSEIDKTWISISGPKSISRTLKFLTTRRLRSVFHEDFKNSMDPHLLIRGTRDVICYPDSVWGPQRSAVISGIGHYASLLHPTTLQRILSEFEQP